MTILALDQSVSGCTGWAILPYGAAAATSGHFVLCEGVHDRAHGFVELFRRLNGFHVEHELAAIVHENPISLAVDQTQKQIALFGLVAVIEMFAASRQIAFRGYDARNWRGTFFSKAERAKASGERWKRLAIERARQLGFDPANHDEAEAIGILDHHLHVARIAAPWRTANPFLPALG